MDAVLIILAVVAFLLLVMIYLVKSSSRAKQKLLPLSDEEVELLSDHVAFYQRLDDAGKKIFIERVSQFLSHIQITGVNTDVEPLDRVLVGASAIIPIFGFPGWQYINLREVLLYPETFNEEFEQEGGGRNVMGMVGNGPMQQVMIISRHALRQGFANKTDKSNTAIHEFVHLIDKTDGDTDGVPEALLNQYSLPWVKLMHRYIQRVRSDKTDINPYAASNEAEFLAVVAEYFFERPDLLQTKHPELYNELKKMYNRK